MVENNAFRCNWAQSTQFGQSLLFRYKGEVTATPRVTDVDTLELVMFGSCYYRVGLYWDLWGCFFLQRHLIAAGVGYCHYTGRKK